MYVFRAYVKHTAISDFIQASNYLYTFFKQMSITYRSVVLNNFGFIFRGGFREV